MTNPSAELIRTARLSAGLTQAQLADRAGISVRALREIEQGRVDKPHQSSLQRLSTALGLDALEPQAPALTISVLGPFVVARQARPVPVTAAAQRKLLTLLALEGDRFLRMEEIAEALWDAQPPEGWRNRLHVLVNQVRDLLEPRRARREPSRVLPSGGGAYRLHLPVDAVDVSRFTHSVELARAAAQDGDAGRAVHAYETALLCWRGPVDEAYADRPATLALRRTYLSAVLELAEQAAAAGQDARALSPLETTAAAEPLHEGLHATLMRAYARTGQQDRALHLYADLRKRLGDELGVDPAPETQAVYREILRPGGADGVDRPRRPRPAQLPLTTPYFGGRDDAVAAVSGHLCGPLRAGEIPSSRILVVHGMPGVGKTTLTVQVAHQVKQRYPDGQLYADLRGESHDPSSAGQLLSGFLRSLGATSADIPEDVAERSALLRSYLAGRRVLMLLDDARSAEQVLPFLPASEGNDVLITSRNPLAGLPVTRYRLDPLDGPSALSLLRRLVPEDDVEGDPLSAARIVEVCGGLPLALSIAAARTHSGDTLDGIARTLDPADGRITGLHSGELALQTTLDSAYGNLSRSAQSLLRRLAAVGTRTIPAWVAAVLQAGSTRSAADTLTELAAAHLVSAAGGSGAHAHYRLHDLVRLYALKLADDEDRAAARYAVAQWAHVARRTTAQYAGGRSLALGPLSLPEPDEARLPEVVDVNNWFDTERDNLLDALADRATAGDLKLAVSLLVSLSPFLRTRHQIDEWRQCIQQLRAVPGFTDDLLASAYTDESETNLLLSDSRDADALPVAEHGLASFRAAGEAQGAHLMRYHLAYVHRRAKRVDQATTLLTEILEAPPGEEPTPSIRAAAHQGMGLIHREYLDDAPGSVRHFEQALALLPDPASREYSQVIYSLCIALRMAGRPDELEPLLAAGIRVSRSLGDRIGMLSFLGLQADVLPVDQAHDAVEEALTIARIVGKAETIGHIMEARARLAERTGDHAEAAQALEEAMAIYERGGAIRSAEQVAKELARLKALMT
ncbi:MAG: helix-turn-helix domain-containing protein [Hamadaea sp.]|uniref:BTAD domain-containing putative transcriptional regulator n=1 Tax=Hamadaea sp. TaxID=2024425 RepID=UPI0017CC4B5C|nr:BTAD domain-containing putative transcriptional regulator [Hamadaea sp.]NUR71376.1 helix-turn-helix domain-containing protein [Hamadaea sp.]NUT22673.1 helix-turn-helix domain-containing protein [Hamadaea sp.]